MAQAIKSRNTHQQKEDGGGHQQLLLPLLTLRSIAGVENRFAEEAEEVGSIVVQPLLVVEAVDAIEVNNLLWIVGVLATLTWTMDVGRINFVLRLMLDDGSGIDNVGNDAIFLCFFGMLK